jgi:hypothetical protein
MIRDIYKCLGENPRNRITTKPILKTLKLVNNKNRKVVPPNAQLTGKKWLAKISERSEQKANCFLS